MPVPRIPYSRILVFVLHPPCTRPSRGPYGRRDGCDVGERLRDRAHDYCPQHAIPALYLPRANHAICEWIMVSGMPIYADCNPFENQLYQYNNPTLKEWLSTFIFSHKMRSHVQSAESASYTVAESFHQ